MCFKKLKKFYGLDKSKNTSLKTEILCGITTFLSISYIFLLIPLVIGEAGISTKVAFSTIIIASIFATLLMSVLAKKPFVLAPSFAMVTFFIYSIVISKGIPWQTALGALFISGIIYMFIASSKLLEEILNAIPLILKKAIAAGIGLFLVLTGLRISGIFVSNHKSFLFLGDIFAPTALLTLFGVVMLTFMISKKKKWAYLWSFLVITLLSWFIGGIPLKGSFFAKPELITSTALKLDILGAFNSPELIFSFLIILFFTTTSIVVSLSMKLDGKNKNKVEDMREILFSDSIGVTFGALFGAPFVSTRAESLPGLRGGAKTGLSSLIVVLLLILLLFLSPLITLIPLSAVAAILIISGLSMVSLMCGLKKKDPSDNVPAYLTMILIPLSFSIAKGIALGFIIYVVSKILSGKLKDLNITSYVLLLVFLTFLMIT